ncbi:MAG: OmpA family protein [Deltaproteobacteria bacterium]|nr:OmpA family protein [Deltaproteobacteria bacterium]
MTPLCKTILAACGLWVLCAAPVGAQTLRDLTDHEPTTEELIQGLRLSSPPPAKGQMRGVGPTSSTQARKSPCESYRDRAQTRGVGVASTAAVSAATGVVLKVTFASGSARLTAEAMRTLDKLGEALHSDELAACCFQIEGHTDSVGSDAYNERLSQHRAVSVSRYLAERHKLKDRTVAVGYGEQKPAADNTTDEGRQKNRRVQVINLGYE